MFEVIMFLVICIVCTIAAFLFGNVYNELQQQKKESKELLLKSKIWGAIADFMIPYNNRINDLQKQIDEMKKP